MDNNTVFNDIIDALHEVEEHQKGNVQLKSNTIELPDDDIGIIYSQLSDNDKFFIRGMIERLLVSH